MDIKTQISDAVNLLTSQSLMFTAFDVTTFLRKNNPGVNIYHSGVNNVVRDMFTSGVMGYDRTLRSVTVTDSAFVYHPFGADPDNYNAVVDLSAAPVATPTVSQVTVSKQVTHKRDAVYLDRFGRIRVPAAVTRDLGLSKGDRVYISHAPMGEVMVSVNPNGRPYNVDEYGNVRLTLPAHARLQVRYQAERYNDSTYVIR
jgi:bifunctional DNA-binding transcriptional regulator/antitoxin component of YhaV-PrlF toxin-antitoxin module